MPAGQHTAQTEAKTRTKSPEHAVVKWQGELISITFNDVKDLICPLATDQETAVFLRTCQSLQLNPFASEIFLIKYTEQEKAALVISISSYLKAAENNIQYDGYEAGIILKNSGGKLEFREGAMLIDDEMDKLAGGWARVYRKDRTRPTYIAVNKAECIRYTKEGRPTKFWTKDKQPSMLRKVALKRALVEAFPSLFSGTLATSEVAGDEHEGEYEVMQEGHLPSAMEKGGAPDWKKFWARARSELGVTSQEAHSLLGVTSIKDDLTDAGWSMEDIWNALVTAVREKQRPTENLQTVERVDQNIDRQAEVNPETGEILTPPDEDDEFGGLEDETTRNAEFGSFVTETDKEPAGAPAPVPAEPAKKRDPATITSMAELFKACYEDFKLQPKDVVKQLGYSHQKDIKESPAVCYQTIAAVEE